MASQEIAIARDTDSGVPKPDEYSHAPELRSQDININTVDATSLKTHPEPIRSIAVHNPAMQLIVRFIPV